MVNRNHIQEAKDKRRGRRLTVIIHILLLLLLFIAFPTKNEEDPTFKKAIIVEFNSGSKSEGAKPAAQSSSENKVKERAKPVEVLNPTKRKPNPPIETSDLEPPIVAPQVKDVDVKVDEPIEELPEEVKPDVKEVPNPKPQNTKPNVPKIKIREIVKILEADIEAADASEGSQGSGTGDGNAENGTDSDNKGTESGSGKGDTGDGKGDNGDGRGNDGKGDGTEWGDGILQRKIIDQPSFTDIIKQEGVLAFNVCVNRQGRVVFGEYNSKISTIRDKTVVSKALERVNQYKFETDYSAPPKECGVVRIVFEFDF